MRKNTRPTASKLKNKRARSFLINKLSSDVMMVVLRNVEINKLAVLSATLRQRGSVEGLPGFL